MKTLKTDLSQLTDLERRLVAAHVQGLTGLAAAEAAGASYRNANSANAAISRAMAHPAAQAYAADIRAKANAAAEEEAVLSIIEKRKFLARIVRTPLVRISPDSRDDPNADLVKKFKRKIRDEGSKDDPEEWIYDEFEKLDPLKALALDNELAGHKAPEKVEHSADDALGQILADIALSAQTTVKERM